MNQPDETALPYASIRQRREVPAREHPVRGAGTMFRPAEVPGREGACAPGGSVERAVDSAYRLIEDHLRRGRDAARAQGAVPPMTNATNLDPQEVARKLTRYWSDMMFMWLDLVTPLAGAVGERVRGPVDAWTERDLRWREVSDPSAAAKTVAGGASGAPGAFEVDLVAAQGARVRLTFNRSPGATLRVRKLRTNDDEETALDARVTLTVDAECVAHLGVVVNGVQPAGVYEAAVIDAATGAHCGLLTIELRAPAA